MLRHHPLKSGIPAQDGTRPRLWPPRPAGMLHLAAQQASRFCFDQPPWPPSLLVMPFFSSQAACASGQPLLAADLHQQASAGGWQRPLALRKQRGPAALAAATVAVNQPQTIADVEDIVAANVPVFTFHHDEQFFPCTVEWFLERARLVRVAKGWRRRLIKVLAGYGSLDGEALAEQQAAFDALPERQRRRSLLMLQLRPDARRGQPERLSEIPVYAHVKQTLDPVTGRRDGIEIAYMLFAAFNGPYKLFRSLWVGPLGAHDADWEHVTVRLTPDGRQVTGVYYSAHRHRDGAWRSAADVPLSKEGRPLAYVAENGHGSYPVAGLIPRLFLVINDYTSDRGPVWDPRKVVLLTQTPDGRLPRCVSRGSTLDGSTYPCRRPPPDVQVEWPPAAWLGYCGRWGSTVVAPQLQEWYARAENPVSRTTLQQVLFPLLPGVDSVWEPAAEELETALMDVQEGMDEGMEAFRDAAEDVRAEWARARAAALRRWERLLRGVKRGPDKEG